MARLPELLAIAERHGLRIITIKDLIRYRIQKDKLVRRAATTLLPTVHGSFSAIAYETTVDDRVVLALTMGEIRGDDPILVRMHSECLTGRRVPLAALRLRGSARQGARHHRRRGARRPRLPPPGGTRHRAPEQDARLRAAGPGEGHGGGERGARVQGGPPRLRHRRADPRRPRHPVHAPPHQQPEEDRRSRGVRPPRRRADADRGAALGREPLLPPDQAATSWATCSRTAPEPRWLVPLPRLAPRLHAAGRRVAIVASRFHEAISATARGGRARRRSSATASGQGTSGSCGCRAPSSCPRPRRAWPSPAASTRWCASAASSAGRRRTSSTWRARPPAASRRWGGRRGVPTTFGLITANTREQAEARAGGAVGNRGEEAALAALELLALFARARSPARPPASGRAASPAVTPWAGGARLASAPSSSSTSWTSGATPIPGR